MNQIAIIGRLSKDVELKQTSQGTSVCTMNVAVNRLYKNADGEQEADFFNVVCWKGLADNCAKFLSKGKKVGVTGYLQNRSYDQDGAKKYITEIVATNVEFLSSKENDSEENHAQPKSSPKKQSTSNKGIENTPPVEDDDLPF